MLYFYDGLLMCFIINVYTGLGLCLVVLEYVMACSLGVIDSTSCVAD